MTFELGAVAVARLVAGLVRSRRRASSPVLATSRGTLLLRPSMSTVASLRRRTVVLRTVTSLDRSHIAAMTTMTTALDVILVTVSMCALRLASGSMRGRVGTSLMTLMRSRRTMLTRRRTMLTRRRTMVVTRLLLLLALRNRVRALLLGMPLAMWTSSLVFGRGSIVPRRRTALVLLLMLLLVGMLWMLLLGVWLLMRRV